MSSTSQEAPVVHPSKKRLWYWLIWVSVVAVACVGLRNYRIDNDIARWTPELAASHGGTFVLIGYERGDTETDEWFERLSAIPDVAMVFPITGDGAMNGLCVSADDNVTDAELLVSVRDALGDDHDRVAIAGPPVFREALDTWSQRGLPTASGLILLIGAVVMWFTARCWRSVIESLVAVFSGQIVLLGLITLTGTAMDMVLSMTPPLLMGLGFSFAAHRATRSGVNRALLLSMATTATALALFVFTDFQPIRAFAVWGATGVVLTWAAVMLLVTPPAPQHRRAAVDHATDVTSAAQRRLAWGCVMIGALVTIGGILALPGLSLQEDTLTYFPDESRVVRDYRRIDTELIGTLPFEVVVDRPDVDPSELISKTPGVRRFERVIADPNTGQTVYFGLASNHAIRDLVSVQSQWNAWAVAIDTSIHWKGVAAQIDHIGQSVWRTACWALPTMLCVTAIAGWLVDRRISSLVLCLWVNAFPVAVLGGWLYLSGRPVGLPSLLISALAIGVAIDDTLHLLLAQKETGNMTRAVQACRRACLGSSLATALCMLTFLLCPFRPTAEFGGLVALAVVAALIGDLLLLPAAMTLLTHNGKYRNKRLSHF